MSNVGEFSMDRSKHLIIGNGKDITADIKSCKYSSSTKKYIVIFNNGKTYPYSYASIEWIKNPEVLNPDNVHIKSGDKELFNIKAISVFHAKAADYWHICF